MLAEYETAANRAIAAMQAQNPERGSVDHYVARKEAGRWVVAFGRFSEQRDRFLEVYEAAPNSNSADYSVKRIDPPREDKDFYYFAAKAIDLAHAEFKGLNVPYHAAVLPGPSDQMYVYFLPAPRPNGEYPLGGDIRYLVSHDGSTILDRHPMHKTIIQQGGALPPGAERAGGFHSHVLSDVPEDTDVFCVLMRKRRVPEFVVAGGHAYEIKTDGTIKVSH